MELPEATKIRLKSQHLIIKDLVTKLSDHELDEEIFSGKWTIRQQLAHLVRYQEIFFERVQTIMNSFNAVFSPYIADDDEGFLKASKLSAPQLINDLHVGRQIIIDFYLNLNSGELYRKGRHTQLGNFSIALWAEFFLLHEAHHIYFIFQMSNQLGSKENSPSPKPTPGE
jgi:hypothetical protein